MGVRMRAWQRREIVFSPNVWALLGDAANDVWKCYTAFQLVGQHRAADIAGGLKTDAGNPGPVLSKSDDLSQLAFIDARLHGANENCAHTGRPERFDCLQLGCNKRFAAKLSVNRV